MAVLVGDYLSNTLIGTNQADFISGLGRADVLRGNGGDDSIRGGQGDDTLYGGHGNDTMHGDLSGPTLTPHILNSPYNEYGNDLLYGGEGNDRMTVAVGMNTLYGGDGDDELLAIPGPGYRVRAKLHGDNGHDYILASDGSSAYGGAGNDRITAAGQTEEVLGGDGNDTITLATRSQSNVFGGLGDDVIGFGAPPTVFYAGRGFVAFGDHGDDTLTGWWHDDALFGNDGRDSLTGGRGNDTLWGGSGNDTVSGDEGMDRIGGEAGNDSLSGGAGSDSIGGGDGFDRLFGGSGDDSLAPGQGNDFVDGGIGNDTIAYAGGRDTLLGDADDDRFTLTPDPLDPGGILAPPGTQFNGGGGTDTLLVAPLAGRADTVFDLSGAVLTRVERLQFSAGSDQSVTVILGAESAAGLQTVQRSGPSSAVNRIEVVLPQTGGAVSLEHWSFPFSLLQRSRLEIAIAGGAGDDTIGGTLTGDVIEASAGHDQVNGAGGADRLSGMAGNDTLNGGTGDDTLIGGEGDDVYVVDAAGDRVFETVTEAGTIDAGGHDTVQSTVSFLLNANAGVRFVEDLVLTGTGNINATGNARANQLTGNGGDNVLHGGLGNDTMTGGAGNDSFAFRTALGAGNVDRITDFNVADDTIRLDDAVFVGLATGGLAASAFAFNLTGTASDGLDRIIYETDTGRLYFDADGTGAGARVHFATLSPSLALTNADFLVI